MSEIVTPSENAGGKNATVPKGSNTRAPNIKAGSTAAAAAVNEEQDGEKKRGPAFLPAAALQRFARDLEDNVDSNKFLRLNQERVTEFIEKPAAIPGVIDETVNTTKREMKEEEKDYLLRRTRNRFLELQSKAEFQKELGTKSRFGEGDGSFFDVWLNSDVIKSKQVKDKDNLPIMTSVLKDSQTGFKKQILDYKFGKPKNQHRVIVKPYKERREERLAKEAAAKAVQSQQQEQLAEVPDVKRTISTADVAFGAPSYDFEGADDGALATERSGGSTGLSGGGGGGYADADQGSLARFPPIGGITQLEKENYFGVQARESFFDYFRVLTRHSLTGGSSQAQLDHDDSMDDGHASLMATSPKAAAGYAKLKVANLPILAYDDGHEDGASGCPPPLNSALSFESNASEDSFVDVGASPLPGAGSDHQPRMSKPSYSRGKTYSRLRTRIDEKIPKTSDDQEIDVKRLLLEHISMKPNAEDNNRHYGDSGGTSRTENASQGTGGSPPRPLSARTIFLMGCISKRITPHAGLLVRKQYSSVLDLSSLGMHNSTLELLASSLPALPMLTELSVADNQLTDVGIVPLLESLVHCELVKLLNLSKNSIETKGAMALKEFLKSDQCNLDVLHLADCNLDDKKVNMFLPSISAKNTLLELDLSENLLGSHEAVNSLGARKIVPGEDGIMPPPVLIGESLALLLTQPHCSLRVLDLQWNRIRGASAVALCKSLAVNKSLKHVDLSFNGLGVDGGMALGNALHSNNSLVTLKLKHNNISSKPCFTILSGVVTCKSLIEVDLAQNPIGEIGARHTLLLNIDHGTRVSVDIKGCTLQHRDPTCTWDERKLKGDYTLDMSNPYERAIMFHIIRLVGKNENMTIEKCKLAKPQEGVQDIEFGIHKYSKSVAPRGVLGRADSMKAGNAFAAAAAAAVAASASNTSRTAQTDGADGTSPRSVEHLTEHSLNSARELFRQTANKIFKQYDTDESGALDREELITILEQMGIDDAPYVVDSLMEVYDSDHSGVVEEAEFVEFLADMKNLHDKSLNKEVQYLYSLPPPPGGTMPPQYTPPEVGIFTFKVEGEQNISKLVSGLSGGSVGAMLDVAKNAAESDLLFGYAMSVVKITLLESKTLFQHLLREIGNETECLQKLLPRMMSSSDARALITYGTNSDFSKIHNLKQRLGNLYRIFTGLPMGYYSINLSDQSDLYCLSQLMEMNAFANKFRQSYGLGDTSQHRNWSGFRNIVLDNNPFEFTEEWLENIPRMGHLSFDFVYLCNFNMKEQTISNFRLFRVMVLLGMTDEGKRLHIFNKLSFNKDEGFYCSRGTGVRKWELTIHGAQEVAGHLHDLYALDVKVRKPVPHTMTMNSDEMVFLGSGLQPVEKKKKKGRKNSVQAPDFTSLAHTMSSDQLDGNPHNEAQRSEMYGKHIKRMIESEVVSEELIAARIVEALEYVIGGRWITCVQLALLLERFPGGQRTVNEFGTYRVEMVVQFFTRIADLINFDYVLKELTYQEYAQVVYRVGWLNIMNPMKAEGGYALDMSRPEERQLVRVLMALNYKEPGDAHWLKSNYDPSPKAVITKREQSANKESLSVEERDELAKEEHSEWHIPVAWYDEVSLPKVGLVSFSYFSGKGVGLDDHSPDPILRHTLMATVLARTYDNDSFAGTNPTNMTKCEAVLESMGCKLSFLNSPAPAATK